jgi:hypothetical protein
MGGMNQTPKRKFSLSKKHWIILACLSVLVAFILLYLFVYIPSNEHYINERRFNSLQRIETNIRNKQYNTKQLFESILASYDTGNTEYRSNIREYLQQAFTNPKTLVFEDVVLLQNDSNKQREATFLFIPKNENIEIIGQKGQTQLKMRYSIVSFFYPLISGSAFDEFVVAIDSSVMYESFSSGMSGTRFDSLIRIDKNVVSGNSRRLKLGGKEYQAYIQTFSLGNKQKGCVLIGLTDFRNYQTERNQLPVNQVIIVFVIGILIMLSLPWIKLFNLGYKDRLTLGDGMGSFIVSMLITSVISLGFAWLAIRYQKHDIKDGLKNISDEIEKRGDAHFKTMKASLKDFDTYVAGETLARKNIVFAGDPLRSRYGIDFNKSIDIKSDTLPENLKILLGDKWRKDVIYQVFWLNSSGRELFNWSRDSFNAPPGNFSLRKYFSDIKEQKDTLSSDHVISWTTGQFRTIIAAKSKFHENISDTNNVACISFNMFPLEGAILPDGYGFAVVNKRGTVIYHQNLIHNLNEIFEEETSDAELIRGAIQSNSALFFESKYKGVGCNMLITPIKFDGLTYHLIVYHDLRFASARGTGAFSFTFLMMLLFFLVIFLQMSLVTWRSSRQTKLGLWRIQTDWIWPRPGLKASYLYSAKYNLLLIATLWIIYNFSSFITFLFILFLAFGYSSISKNIFYKVQYANQGKFNQEKYKSRNIISHSIIMCFVFIFGCYQLWDDKSQLLIFLLFQMITLIITFLCVLWFESKKPFLIKSPITKNKNVFVSNYILAGITRLVITSGIPVLFFFQTSMDYQMAIEANYKSNKFAHELKHANLRKDEMGLMQLPTNMYSDNLWIGNLVNRKSEPSHFFRHELLTFFLLNKFRVYKNDATVKMDAFAIHDRKQMPNKDIILKPPFIFPLIRLKDSDLSNIPANLEFRFLMNLNWEMVFALIGFILILILFYNILRSVVKRIFAFDVPGKIMSPFLAQKLLMLNKGSRLTFVTGLPGSKKMTFINQIIEKEDRLDIDLFRYSKDVLIGSNHQYVIINHFEYALYEPAICKDILELLEKLMVLSHRPFVVILSTVHAHRALQMINQMVSGDSELMRTSVGERFLVILAHYKSIIIPLNPEVFTQQGDGKADERTGWLDREFLVSPFVSRLHSPFEEDFLSSKLQELRSTPKLMDIQNASILRKYQWIFNDENSLEKEEVIWNLQNVVGIFYHHIWQALSAEERYLLYDLAEDGLVNPSNKYHLSMLLQKGLIQRKDRHGQLKLMNESFRSFVLISVNREEALELKNEVKGSGTWDEIRTPLMLVIIGILGILLASQQQAFTTIIGYLTAIAAIIPTLNALFTFIKPAGGAAK